MINFIFGVMVGIITQWFIIYLRRARLKIKVEATFEWFAPDSYFPYLRIFITNNGHTKTEVIKVLIEFKNGSTNIQEEMSYYRKITAVEAKTTELIKFNNLSTMINKKYFEKNNLYRFKIITIDDKVFCSKWLETKRALKIWKR